MKSRPSRKKTTARLTVIVQAATKQSLKLRAHSLRCTQNQLAVALIAHQLANTSARATIKDREYQLLAKSLVLLISRLSTFGLALGQHRNEQLLAGRAFVGEATLVQVQTLLDQAQAARDLLGGMYAGKHPDPNLTHNLQAAESVLPAVFTEEDPTAQAIAEYLIALNILPDLRPDPRSLSAAGD